jgi:GntR family transcriptional regulator
LRPGSGVYVCDRRAQTNAGAAIDSHIAEFFRRAHDLGLSSTALRARLAEWIAVPAPDHWLLVDSNDEARQILMTELRSVNTRDVRESSLAECCDAERITGAIVCCRPTQEQPVRAAVPAGVEVVTLPITSANQWLLPWLPAPKGLLIAVVSHWPEFLEKARAMLAAAGVPTEALIFCDARKPGWQRGVRDVSGILCDAYTASIAKLPKGPQIVTFPLLAKSAREVLEQAWL